MRKFPRLIEFLVLATLAIGGAPAAAAIWNWSTTASSNATADPSINWAEGMSPSSVNDSARAMMAAVAAWRNDISGVNTTAGSSTAYTLTTSEGLNTTPVTGTMIAFFAHVTSGVNPSLTTDGGNTYPLQLNAVAPASGTLIAFSRITIDIRISMSKARATTAQSASQENPSATNSSPSPSSAGWPAARFAASGSG